MPIVPLARQKSSFFALALESSRFFAVALEYPRGFADFDRRFGTRLPVFHFALALESTRPGGTGTPAPPKTPRPRPQDSHQIAP